MNLKPIARIMLQQQRKEWEAANAERARRLHVEPDMLTPEGKTCGDCAHWPRCSALICSLKPENPFCDFAPSRFTFRRAK